MSERSRRRRRRRRGGAPADGERRVERETPQGQPVSRDQAAGTGRGRRRRRGRARGQERKVSSPKSSEDLVRALPRERPATLTAPADGQTLEGLIGDLQSEYGVPQYPQEYRITVKVAEERDRGERPAQEDQPSTPSRPPPPPPPENGGPRREKAPSMRTAVEGGERDQSAGGEPRKRSRRRRRRGRGGGGQSPGPQSAS
jgi:hypothetical protein